MAIAYTIGGMMVFPGSQSHPLRFPATPGCSGARAGRQRIDRTARPGRLGPRRGRSASPSDSGHASNRSLSAHIAKPSASAVPPERSCRSRSQTARKTQPTARRRRRGSSALSPRWVGLPSLPPLSTPHRGHSGDFSKRRDQGRYSLIRAWRLDDPKATRRGPCGRTCAARSPGEPPWPFGRDNAAAGVRYFRLSKPSTAPHPSFIDLFCKARPPRGGGGSGGGWADVTVCPVRSETITCLGRRGS